MKKLSLIFIIAILSSSYALSQDTNSSGKIRFVGQIVAPSCELSPNHSHPTKISFSNCKIENPQGHKQIQKINTTIQSKKTSTKNIDQWTVVYK